MNSVYRKVLCSSLALVLLCQLPVFSQVVPYGQNASAGKFVRVNGINIYYEVYGKGEPLLLLHGNSQSIADWQLQIPVFANYFKVIVPDSRAQGNSEDGAAEITYDLMASDMRLLLDSLKIPDANIVGWSDGGNTGIAMALLYPDKIRKLITVGANFKMDTTAVGSDVIELLQDNLKKEQDSKQKKLLTLMLNYPTLTSADLAKIKIPVTVMAGEFDAIRDGHTRELAASIPGSELYIMKGAGHFLPYEQPEEFNKVILTYLGAKQAPYFEGRVLDAKSHEPIQYTNVYVAGTDNGTATDLTGSFKLQVPSLRDTLIISAIGYETQKMIITNVTSKKSILLTPRDYLLKEVVVQAKRLTPESIMKAAVSNLEKNYPQNAYGLEMYVTIKWKGAQEDSTVRAEAVVQGYNQTGYARRVHAYFHLMNKFNFKILAQRRQHLKDSTWVMPYSSDMMYREPIRFSNNPLNKGNLKNFVFQFEDIVETEHDTVYVISFKCKDPSYWNTAETFSTEFLGQISIHAGDYAIVKFMATNIADRDLLARKKKKSRYLPNSRQAHYEVKYVKTQGYYFPSTIKTYNFAYNDSSKTHVTQFDCETIVYKVNFDTPEPITAPKRYKDMPFENVPFDNKFWRVFIVPQPIGTK